MDIYDRILVANANAQLAFAAMLDAHTVGDPTAPETRRYIGCERVLDSLIAEVQRPALEREVRSLAHGDHFAYPDDK